MKLLAGLGLVMALGVATVTFAFTEARRTPLEQATSIELPTLPRGTKPLKVALISDTHVAGPDNSPARLERLVLAVNRRQPDLILLAGDYIGEAKAFGRAYSRAEALGPFAKLKAPLGVVAVLGNHDYWDDPRSVAATLKRSGIIVLRNQAVSRGPLVIGGVDDDYTGQDDVRATVMAASKLKGAALFLTHSPDVFPHLPPRSVLLAGHTHCGQVAIPYLQKLYIPSRFKDRYRCGRYQERGKTLIVSGGISTSVVPLRLFARPQWWLIKIAAPS